LAVLYSATRSEQTLSERIENALGKWSIPVYAAFGAYYLCAILLPLLDLEKFSHAVFFDTAPTTFYFTVFFLFSAFFSAKGIQSIGRIADLCLFLFLIPFFALIVMSLTETDFSHLLPLFGTDFSQIKLGIRNTSPHFSDVALLLPLLANCRFQSPKHKTNLSHETTKGDKLVLLGYVAGALFTMLFLAVFYAIFSALAPREHYAFSKIAQYFPALEVIGRIDFLFIYLLTIVLFFYTCLPIHYTIGCTAKILKVQRRSWISAVLHIFLFLFVLFCNRFYNTFYGIIAGKLAPVFWVVSDMLPLFLLFLPKPNTPNVKKHKKETAHA
jgi:hypothetical protein